MNLLDLPVRRPVAVGMVFVGMVILGLVGWQRIPVELMPALQGDSLFVRFWRAGSEPETVEREILLPLQARVSALPDVAESWGRVRGAGGDFRVRFEAGTDIKVRELELRRIAAAIQREQPRGQASVSVSSIEESTSAQGSFVMMVHVLGGGRDGVREVDLDALYDRADQLLAPRFASVPGVSEAVATGGARRQVTVTVDPHRVVAAGVTPMQVVGAVSRNMEQTRHVGTLESANGRQEVLMEGHPPGLHGLENLRIRADGPAKLKHVADIAFGVAPNQSYLRVNGEPAVGVVIFQEQGANLIRLGRALRERVEELRRELAPLGLDLVIGSDAADEVEKQIGHLGKLALSGYLIALVVLFLFLREWRAVAVVGLAVPVSLLAAIALLYVFDQTLNVISLIGLSLSIGLLIDNSIVVYEAVLRGLERGASPADAARRGVRRTALAIAAASLTTAIVFLPMTLVDLDTTVAGLFGIVAAALLLPLAASLLVAVGLVPVLAYRLAAPAAAHRVERGRVRRARSGGLRPPDPARILFAGVLKNALRRPAAWLAGTFFAVLFTFITAVPLALSGSGRVDAERADEVRMTGRYARGAASAGVLAEAVGRVETAVMRLDGVDTVVSEVTEEGASITVRFVEEDQRPEQLTVSRVREVARDVAEEIKGFELLRPGEASMGGKGRGGGGEVSFAMGGAPREVVLSGPETAPLNRLARDVVARLKAVPDVANAWRATPPGMDELWVEPNRRAFEAFGLTLDEVLPVLQVAGREGFRAGGGFLLASGREIPVVVERVGAREPFAVRDLRRLRVQTESGVAPVAALASIRQMPPSPVITHHNGRREASVFFRLGRDVPDSGPGLTAIEKEIAAVVQTAPRQSGYTVEVREEDDTDSLARKLALPALLLLALVLAMAFESLTLPLLVLLALPLAVLGSAWLFVLTGTPASVLAGAGVIMLFGLAVNPAILLMDRIAQRVRGGWSAGAAALAAVRERTRPVLMTSATTIAALWPLAITTGRENEMWPPFAIVVIGGLITSTVLTLLVIPVAYILLQRLDRVFGRVGPWLVVGWFGATLAVMLSLTLTDIITSLLWQAVTSLLVGSGLLAVTVLAFRRVEAVAPDTAGGPPPVDVRNLKKTYGLPGPLRAALRAGREFRSRVLGQGGVVEGVGFEMRDGLRRFGPPLVLTVAPFVVAGFVNGAGWKLLLWLLGAAFFGRLLQDVRRARGRADAAGVVEAGGPEGVLRAFAPWIVLAVFVYSMLMVPYWADEPRRAPPALVILMAALLGAGQLVRRSAVRQQRGLLEARVRSGPFRYPRTMLRRWALRLGGFDLPVRPVRALSQVNFRVERGMVGILGPNGAGKTTLLRQLAGILDPTRGTIFLGGVALGRVRRVLARWVGYLPQDAGLPGGLSGREYLMYFAALYDLPVAVRRERVEGLLREVGLEGKADDKIRALSGGMRQRVAVARTLLRLPPVIIVDEPTVGLDPRERIRFRNLLSRLAEDRIVLFSTHVVEDVAVACERVLVLAKGRLVFDGEPAALAHAAEGRVWEVRSPALAPFDLPRDAILAEEAPAADVTVRRILRATAPTADATAVPARLEDGYLWLISDADAALRARGDG